MKINVGDIYEHQYSGNKYRVMSISSDFIHSISLEDGSYSSISRNSFNDINWKKVASDVDESKQDAPYIPFEPYQTRILKIKNESLRTLEAKLIDMMQEIDDKIEALQKEKVAVERERLIIYNQIR